MSLHPDSPGDAAMPADANTDRHTGPGMGGRLARWLGDLPGLPGQCAICRAWPARTLCDACIGRFAPPTPRCRRCALPVPLLHDVATCGECLRHPSGLDLCLAACDYAWPWVDCIARLKFEGQPGWAQPLAELMGQAPGAQAALDAANLVLPMPLHERRLRWRGFNQSLELARRLRRDKCRPDLLLRLRNTPAQQGLRREQRLANLRGAFGIAPDQAADVCGARVVLVDDVMTSGASLSCVAQVLRAAGAAHITGLVLARTASPGTA